MGNLLLRRSIVLGDWSCLSLLVSGLRVLVARKCQVEAAKATTRAEQPLRPAREIFEIRTTLRLDEKLQNSILQNFKYKLRLVIEHYRGDPLHT